MRNEFKELSETEIKLLEDTINNYAGTEEKQYLDNGNIKVTDVRQYVQIQDIKEILEDVLDFSTNGNIPYNDSWKRALDEEGTYHLITRLFREIETDDYIIADWYSQVDEHEYQEMVINLVG